MILIFFLSFVGTANAQVDTLAKLLAEAAPGWYLHIKSEIKYVAALEGEPPRIVQTSPSESFNHLTSEWDEKSKPRFMRKQSQRNPSLPSCVNDTLIFRMGDQEFSYVGQFGIILGSPPMLGDGWSHTDCDRILSWELIQKKCDDFVGCVTGKLAQKFPFDILGNLPSSKITCPKITISIGTESRDFDLCWMYEAMRPLKYVIAMSLLIKLFIYS